MTKNQQKQNRMATLTRKITDNTASSLERYEFWLRRAGKL